MGAYFGNYLYYSSGTKCITPELSYDVQDCTHKMGKSASQAVLSRMQLTLHATLNTSGKSASQAVLRRMQLTLHATLNTSHRLALGSRDVCLVGENPTCSVPSL